MKKGADFMTESVTQRDIYYYYYYQPFTCFRFLLNKKSRQAVCLELSEDLTGNDRRAKRGTVCLRKLSWKDLTDKHSNMHGSNGMNKI